MEERIDKSIDNSVASVLSDEEVLQLSKMNVEDIIKKYAQLKLSLEKQKERTYFFSTECIDALKKNELLRLKYANIDSAKYNPKWSWVNKIVYVLTKVDRPLSSPEIIELIRPYEPLLVQSRHPAQAFSASLNKAVKYQRVFKYKLGGSRGFYYVLAEWMEHEKLRKEYSDKIFFK